MTLPTLQERGGALSGLVQGTGQGLQQALPSIAEMILNKQKQQQIAKSFPNLFGTGGQTQNAPDLSMQGQVQQSPDLGMQQQTPSYNLEDAAKAALMGQHDLANTIMKGAEMQQKQSLLEQKQTFSREQSAEPELRDLNKKLEAHEQSKMRYDRLAELYSPELESKFPPTFAVGMFTKDGQLTPLAESQLSPEAQEAVKLTIDEIRGAKDTFGARVTNFDADLYLKTLPRLLNSAEGRRRILRDRQIINDLNIMHDQGILDIMDRSPSGKMSLSKAEQIFKKENESKIKELRSEFVNPNKNSFTDLPEARRYQDRVVVDSETGQKFRSNGKEWIPEGK